MMRWTAISFQAECHRPDAAGLATVCARLDVVIIGINDRQARRMYLCLLILNGPDLQSSGPLL